MATKKAAVRRVKPGPRKATETVRGNVEGSGYIHARETEWWIARAREAAEKSGLEWSAWLRKAIRTATQAELGPLAEPRSCQSFEDSDPFG